MIRVSALLCVLSLSACGRSHERDTLDLRDPSNAREHAGAGTGAATDPQSNAQMSIGGDSAVPGEGGASGAGDSDLGGPAPIAAAGEDGSEVWIGQLWSSLPYSYLCTPDLSPGDDRSRTLSSPDNTQRVVLLLESVGSDGLGGRIQFGTGAPPDGPPTHHETNDNGYTTCSFSFPTAGFEYPLFDAERSSERLTFSIAPLRVWNGWCATQTQPAGCSWCANNQNICECTDGACKVATNSRLVFDLAITSDTIEGEIPLLGELRLTRKR